LLHKATGAAVQISRRKKMRQERTPLLRSAKFAFLERQFFNFPEPLHLSQCRFSGFPLSPGIVSNGLPIISILVTVHGFKGSRFKG